MTEEEDLRHRLPKLGCEPHSLPHTNSPQEPPLFFDFRSGKDAPKDLDRLLLEAAPRHRDAPCLSQGPDKGCQYQREMDET